MTTVQIFNNSAAPLPIPTQRAIINACLYAGIKEVIIEPTHKKNVFEAYDEKTETYQFSINANDDVIFWK